MKWFDAGVNLLDSRLQPEQIIMSAVDAGVSRLCVITTHPNEWQRAYELYQQFPEHICYTIGVHPHHAKDVTPQDWQTMRHAVTLPGVVAIGECGLDFNRNFSPKEQQIEVFERQLAVAVECQLPVYLHERDAFAQQHKILANVANTLAGGIAHCFTGTQEQMQAYLALGLYIGITGWVCDDKRGQDLRDSVRTLPLSKLILETDAPYLFPKNRRPRARHNEPAFLPAIGEYVAQLTKNTPSYISEVSYANSCQLFNIVP
jgi:TatD DNase family protein